MKSSPIQSQSRKPSRRQGRSFAETLESRLFFSTTVPGGTIATAVEWTAANSPYVVSNGVVIGAGGSLTIDSGVNVDNNNGGNGTLIIASGGTINATSAHFDVPFTVQQGSSGSISGSSFDAGVEFDNTSVTVSGNTFTTNPSVYSGYIPTITGSGNTFAPSTLLDIESGTVTTPLTFPVVTNIAGYSLPNGFTVGSGGSLTVDSGVSVDNNGGGNGTLIVASGGTINATSAHFDVPFTARQGSSGSISGSSFDAGVEFDNTSVTVSANTFTTNPSVYSGYIPTIIGSGNTFAPSTLLDIESGTVTTPLTFPVVTNISGYSLPNGFTVGSGGSLTVDSSVSVDNNGGGNGTLIVASGGTINATSAHFDVPFTARQGSSGSISGSSFDAGVEFDNTSVTVSANTFTTNPSVYSGYIPTIIGSGNTFAPSTLLDIESGTVTTPLTFPVVTNISGYSLPNGFTVGSGGSLTVDSGVSVDNNGGGNGTLIVASGGELSADAAAFACPLSIDGGGTVYINNCNLSASSVTATGNGGPIPLIDNWWGSTSVQTIESLINDQTNNPNLPAVTFQPFLTSNPTVAATASTVSSTPSTTSANAGDSVTLTATIPGSPTGVVTFVADGVYLGTSPVSGNTATLTTTGLPAGSDQVTAVYGGDVNYSGNTSAPAAITVATVIDTTASTTTLNTSATQIAQGSSVTFTATVTGSGATPTGTVTFTQDGNTLGSEAVQGDGTAQFSTSSLALGNDSIIATYSGDSNYSGSTSSAIAVDVTNGNVSVSTISVTSSSPAAAFGAAVTLEATVSSASGTGPTPTGTVTFFNDGNSIGTEDLNSSGQASITTSSLPAGSDTITATYNGDGNYSASSLSPETETIEPPSPIQPTLSGVTLPPAIVAGQTFHGKVPLFITNQGAKLGGLYTADFYVSDSTSLNGSQMLVGSASKRVSLREGGSTKLSLSLKSLPSSLGNGTYYIIAQVTDPNGNMSTSGASNGIQIAAAFVQPVVSVGAVAPSTVAANKTASILVTVTNNGNVPATGLSVFLGVSSDGVTQVAGVTLASGASHVKLAPEKPTHVKLHFKLTPALQTSLAAGSYLPFVNVTLGGVSTSVVGTSSFTIG